VNVTHFFFCWVDGFIVLCCCCFCFLLKHVGARKTKKCNTVIFVLLTIIKLVHLFGELTVWLFNMHGKTTIKMNVHVWEKCFKYCTFEPVTIVNIKVSVFWAEIWIWA
jgi:hypothetical protein